MTDVLYAVDGPVATITLNRPDRLNAIVPGMGEEYAAALLRADADPAVRAIVVTGAGRGFCAGADLGALSEGPETKVAVRPGLNRVYVRLSGAGDAVTVRASTGALSLCVASGPVGYLAPR